MIKRIEFDPRKIYRYNKDLNMLYIDIDLDFYRELYNAWDFSPLYNRDLDEDLIEYLATSSQEIPPKYNLTIAFHLPEEIRDPTKEEKCTFAFRNFLAYSLRKVAVKKNSIISKIFSYGFLGLLLIVISFVIQSYTSEKFPFTVLSEGFNIGGWVLFWEMFSIIFFTLSDIGKEKKNFKRLFNAKIHYDYKQRENE